MKLGAALNSKILGEINLVFSVGLPTLLNDEPLKNPCGKYKCTTLHSTIHSRINDRAYR